MVPIHCPTERSGLRKKMDKFLSFNFKIILSVCSCFPLDVIRSTFALLISVGTVYKTTNTSFPRMLLQQLFECADKVEQILFDVLGQFC